VVINEQFKMHALWQPLLLVQNDWLKSMQAFLELAQKKLEEAEDEGDQVSMKSSLIALQLMREQIGFVIKGDPNFVSWVELTAEREPHRVHLRAAPIDVGPLVQEHLFAKNKSVIVTSAILQVRERFDYLKQRLGFLENTELEFSEQAVGSPFEYEKQVLFCVPSDIPQVSTDREFVAYTNDFLQQLFGFCQGKTLILFTSYKTLQAVYSKLRVPMERRGFHVLCQGKHGSRRAILNRFKECDKGILLGTDSFWEGVDIADLDCVVIQKLPFAVPSDVLQMARTEKITGMGENAFMAYTLPQAIMKFRQGAGRLIRSKTGHGAIIVLDRRIFEKNYGGMFREALPKCTYIQADKEKVLEEIELWLSQKNAGATPQTSESLVPR
jgi:ATP-dependent DNA helicase DinG